MDDNQDWFWNEPWREMIANRLIEDEWTDFKIERGLLKDMEFELHKGDIVKIREWDDMAAQYGVSKFGDIYLENSPYFFDRDMRHLCGQYIIVDDVDSRGVFHYTDKEYTERWGITKQMVEPVTESTTYDMGSIDGFIRELEGGEH